MDRKVFLTVFVSFLLYLLAPAVHAWGAQTRFTVVFKGNTLPSNAEAAIKAAGGDIVMTIPEIGVAQVEGEPALMEALGKEKSVEAVTPTLQTALKFYGGNGTAPEASAQSYASFYEQYQWDIKQVTRDGASYAIGSGSHDTVVAVIDSGINTTHGDLIANLLGGRNFVPARGALYGGLVPAESGDPSDIEDKLGHGSHVAGAIAGNGRILGVGPGLGIKVYRVFDALGSADSTTVFQAIVSAADDGVDVISMSLGGYDSITGGTWTDPWTGEVYRFRELADYLAWKRAVRYAVSKGAVVVASAGNEMMNIASPREVTEMLNTMYGSWGYHFDGASREVPSSLPGVVSVSATGPSKQYAIYTNYGSGAIDVCAPGGDARLYLEGDPGYLGEFTFSAWKSEAVATGLDWYATKLVDGGDEYAWMAGTSMAAPKASAVAALIIDRAKARGERLQPAQTVGILKGTAEDLGKTGYDAYYGFGLVDAYGALGGK